MVPSPGLVMSKQSPRPVSKAVLYCAESLECESYRSAFSAFMTTQLSRDTSNLECCSKRTLFAIEWQRQCSMDLHQQFSALLIALLPSLPRQGIPLTQLIHTSQFASR